jgi:hypothetical protein
MRFGTVREGGGLQARRLSCFALPNKKTRAWRALLVLVVVTPW